MCRFQGDMLRAQCRSMRDGTEGWVWSPGGLGKRSMLVHHRVEGISLDVGWVTSSFKAVHSRSLWRATRVQQGPQEKNTNWAGVRSVGNSLRSVSFRMLPTLAAVWSQHFLSNLASIVAHGSSMQNAYFPRPTCRMVASYGGFRRRGERNWRDAYENRVYIYKLICCSNCSRSNFRILNILLWRWNTNTILLEHDFYICFVCKRCDHAKCDSWTAKAVGPGLSLQNMLSGNTIMSNEPLMR